MTFAGFKASGLSASDVDDRATTSLFYRDSEWIGMHNTTCTSAGGQNSHADSAGMWSASCAKPLTVRTTLIMRINGRTCTSGVAVAQARPCG
jgi:hypothetical protein